MEIKVSASTALVLRNSTLCVALDPAQPIVLGYEHNLSGLVFKGASRAGCLTLNGAAVAWDQWETTVTSDTDSATYRMRHSTLNVGLTWLYRLVATTLAVRLERIDDPDGVLTTLGWLDLPLLVCGHPGFSCWRMFVKPPDPTVGNKMWATDSLSTVADLSTESEPTALLYGTAWNDTVCLFVDTNYPLFPISHQKRSDGTYVFSVNTWQYRVRGKTMPLLEMTVGFLTDINGDGRADVSDYRLWINRSRPKGDSLYYDAIAYKIFMHFAPPGMGPATTIEESEAIIRAIHHITDGLPQIIYLVGHQMGGHDGAYPTLGGGVDPLVGTEAQLRALAGACKTEYNAILSSHTNIDDAYGHSADWDERYVVRSPGQDVFLVQGSICHTRDAERGQVFRRLEEFLTSFPVEQTLHFDNLRLTNTFDREGWEGIGVLEELVCGVMPVMSWLRDRGITVTTEGYNGMPIDPSCIVSGFWHHDPPDRMRQILHRRLSGGGRGSHFGQHTTYDYGVCNSVHFDITARPWPPDNMPTETREKYFDWLPTKHLTWSLAENWKEMTDCLYLGSLLHHFYNEREMLAWEDIGEGRRITYSGGVVADVCLDGPDSLTVTMRDVTVAVGSDRFIPREGAVYAYSRDGSDRLWTLPKHLRGKELSLFTLSKSGRGLCPDFEVLGNSVRLRLFAGEPVKIEAV